MTKDLEVRPITTTEHLPQKPDFQEALINILHRSDVDPARLEKFLDIKIKLEERNAEAELNKAMVKFQSECSMVLKTKKGHNTNYAPLEEIVHTIKKPMANNGLSYSFDLEKVDSNEMVLYTTIRHEMGGKFVSKYFFNSEDLSGSKNAAQARKSALSYARRAGLEEALGLATVGHDDDGRMAANEIASDEQMNKIQSLIKTTNSNEEMLLSFLQLESLEGLSKKDAQTAIHALQNKRQINVQNNTL